MRVTGSEHVPDLPPEAVPGIMLVRPPSERQIDGRFRRQGKAVRHRVPDAAAAGGLSDGRGYD